MAASLRRLVARRWLPASLSLPFTGAVLLAGNGLIAARAAHPSDDLLSIAIAPASVALAPGGAQQLQVSGVTPSGGNVSPSVVRMATGGTITTDGLYHAGTVAGTYRVVATATGGISDTSVVTIGASGVGSVSEGPAGCTGIYEDNFSSLEGIGLLSTGVGPVSVSGAPQVVTLVTPDPAAPLSPPAVLQVTFGVGWGGATTLGVALRRPLTGAYSSLFLSVWFLLDPTWPGPGAGPDLALSVASGPLPADRVRFNLGVMRSGQLLPHLRVTGLARSYRGSTNPLLVANVDSQPQVTPGVWHKWSVQVVSNGTGTTNDGLVTWWLDGVLAGSYGGVGLWSGAAPAIREIGIEATPPPTPLTASRFLRLDHWHATGLTHPTVGAGTGPDQVQVSGNTKSTPAELVTPPELAVFMRARRSGTPPCLGDTLVDDILASTFPSLVARSDCRPDVIAVFSVDNAARLDAGECDAGVIWTAVGGETRKELLGPLVTVPVVLWLTEELNPSLQANNPGDPLEPLVRAELADANDRFNWSRAGIKFEVTETHRVWDTSADAQAAREAIKAPVGAGSGCSPGLKDSPFFRPGKINVYYVAELPAPAAGLNCRSVDPNIIYISNAVRAGSTLAHELGHAFSLEHVYEGNTGPWYYNGSVPIFDDTNLMWGVESTNRGRLSLGQVYRINGDARSVLQRNGLRQGPRWVCECTYGQPGCHEMIKYRDSTQIDGVCPRITRDWQ